jgi:hypothetical protein
MNPDQVLIQSAYEDTVKRLYTSLFMGFQDAGGALAQEQQAEQNFSTELREPEKHVTALLPCSLKPKPAREQERCLQDSDSTLDD